MVNRTDGEDQKSDLGQALRNGTYENFKSELEAKLEGYMILTLRQKVND